MFGIEARCACLNHSGLVFKHTHKTPSGLELACALNFSVGGGMVTYMARNGQDFGFWDLVRRRHDGLRWCYVRDEGCGPLQPDNASTCMVLFALVRVTKS